MSTVKPSHPRQGTPKLGPLCRTEEAYCIEIIPDGVANGEPLDWEQLRSTHPLSNNWGLDRGLPIDRHYIHQFLRAHQSDVRGDVLEVKEPVYTQVFGHGVAKSHVVDLDTRNQKASTYADLGQDSSLPTAAFDCFILTQTLHLVFEIETAVRNVFQSLRPNGVVLATLPCVSRIDPESGEGLDFWRFTRASAERLFASSFGVEAVEVMTFGNVLTCSAFLHGLATSDLTPEEIEYVDSQFPLITCVRAIKGPS